MPGSREGACLGLGRVHAWVSGGCMPGSREGACLGLGRVQAWVSGGCMPGSREGACLGFGRVHALVSGGCMPWSLEGACLRLDRCMYSAKNKEKKKKVKNPQNCTLAPQLRRAPRQGLPCPIDLSSALLD